MAETRPAIITSFRRDESGATMVEYALLVGLIATIAVLAVGTVGEQVAGAFQGLSEALNEAPRRCVEVDSNCEK